MSGARPPEGARSVVEGEGTPVRTKPRLGYIGLGAMGQPIALRLLAAGFALTVCDRHPAAAERLAAAGARVAATPAEVASEAETVFACLPSPAVSEQVAGGPQGVVHGSAVRLYIENSTIGAASMQRIAAALAPRGIGLLDAPVSGGPLGAAAGRMSCFVAAAEADYAQAEPALRAMCDRLFHIGATPGQSQVLKLANNLLNAACLTISSEMLQMAVRAGIPAATALEVVNASTGRNRATEETLKAQILTGRYGTGARLDILAKDVDLALAEAAHLGAPHAASQGVQAVWQAAMQAGRGGEDLSRIYDFIAAQGAGHAG